MRKKEILMINKTASMIKTASPELKYHYHNGIPISENVFRPGSAKFFKIIREAKSFIGTSVISSDDEDFLRTDIGEFADYNGKRVPLDFPMEYSEKLAAEYKGKKVKLNKPMRGGKKFYVYVKNKKGNVQKINFGDGGNLKVKLNDPKARRSFAKRHRCSEKTDKTTAGYWACRIGRYWKSLGGKKNFSGYW